MKGIHITSHSSQASVVASKAITRRTGCVRSGRSMISGSRA